MDGVSVLKRNERETKLSDVLLTIFLVVLGIGAMKIGGIICDSYIDQTDNYIFSIFIKEVIKVVVAVSIAIILKKIGYLKFKIKGFGEGIITGLFLIVTSGLGPISFILNIKTITVSSIEVVLFLLHVLFVGIGEELLFRGILQNAMHEYFGEDSLKKVYKAIILSSTLFGMVHLVNVFKGVTFLSAFFQALVAIPVGVLLGAMYYRSNKNLWVCIIVHASVDMNSFIASGVLSGTTITESINEMDYAQIITFILFVVVDMYVLRKSVMKKRMACN